ncbi:MAG: hypothetical protein Q8R57_01470 [Bacteroidota bacterium]|jgi:polyferredoxin|nr:hypothetical protein [Bacteroidota bacterium]
MKKNENSEQLPANIWVNVIYFILLIPFSVIVLLNKLFAPLAPTMSFSELEQV